MAIKQFKQRIYLCGDVTNGGQNNELIVTHNLSVFANAEAELKGQYFVLNPTNCKPITEKIINKFPSKIAWFIWMCRSFRMMMSCDFVVLLEGWEKSRGARIEVFVAECLAIRTELFSNIVYVFYKDGDEN